MARTEHLIANSPAFRKDLQALARNLRRLRIASGLTLTALAARLGCSFQNLSGIEHGRSCSLGVYRALCRELNGGRGMMGE